MPAVDTNLIVRMLLVDDDPAQSEVAKRVFSSGRVWISKTVLLETAWVLGSIYRFDQETICTGFATLIGLRNVCLEDEEEVRAALTLAAKGLELADALHLASRPADESFVSFDKALVERAVRAGERDVFEAGSEIKSPHRNRG